MHRLFYLSAFLLTILTCKAQSHKMPLIKSAELRGRVKLIKEILDTLNNRTDGNPDRIYRSDYYYNTSGKLDSSISFSPKGFIVRQSITYDDKGHKIKEVTYNNRKGTFKRQLLCEYFYNQKGTISKTITLMHKNIKVVILYNEHGDQVEVDEYKLQRSTDKKHVDSPKVEIIKNIYGDNGMLYEAKFYNTDTLVRICRYQHDRDSNVTEILALSPDGKAIEKQEYSYDPDGRNTEYIGHDANGNVTSRSTIKYDNYGNLSDMIYYKRDGSIDFHSHTDYEYDKEGNWIKRISLSKKGEKVVDTRIIEYY